MDINPSNSYAKLLSMLNQESQSSSKGLLTQTANDQSATDKAAANQKAKKVSNLNDYSDKVSLSVRAEKLNKITKEFFSGTISSAQIPALTKRLYEDGFLNDAEYQKLGGQPQKVSAISQAASFVNRLILSDDTDAETAKQLKNVASAIANMDLKSTPALRKVEVDAFEFIASHIEKLKENGASADELKGFTNVLDVLSALDKVRKQETNTGALTSYASVQEAYEKLFNVK